MSEVDAQADFDDALARAFAKIESAKKDKRNPHLGNKYADLASVTEAIKLPLTSEGFSWPQEVSMDNGMVVVTTHLRRKGVELTSVLPMPVSTDKKGNVTAQTIGSAITYARRYSLSAMVGVTSDDDDGNAASQGGGGPIRKTGSRGRKQEQPKPDESAPVASPQWKEAYGKYQKRVKHRAALIEKHGLTDQPKAGAIICRVLGVKSQPRGRDISPEDWDRITRAVADDIDDIEMTVEAERLESVAGEFNGTVEGAAE